MKITEFLKNTGKSIVNCIKTKTYGCFVALVGWALTIAYVITYSGMDKNLFNQTIITAGVIGMVLFAALSLFKKTSPLAPIVLMVTSLISLGAFAATDGMIDYISTEFFDGISIAKVFSLPVSVWFSAVAFLLTFIISSVAIYLPQNKKCEKVTTKREVESV